MIQWLKRRYFSIHTAILQTLQHAYCYSDRLPIHFQRTIIRHDGKRNLEFPGLPGMASSSDCTNNPVLIHNLRQDPTMFGRLKNNISFGWEVGWGCLLFDSQCKANFEKGSDTKWSWSDNIRGGRPSLQDQLQRKSKKERTAILITVMTAGEKETVICNN